jgi:L-ribulose-5-phosphate 4-epimerase
MNQDGYIKFHCVWQKAKPFPDRSWRALDQWRNKLYELGLIGAYDNGVGFGNISRRIKGGNAFMITGSGTGNFERLAADAYTKVTAFDIDGNVVECAGPIKASSESLTHGAIYLGWKEAKAVVHVHHAGLWQRLLHRLPTTAREALYGSPEMAREVIRLVRQADTREKKIIIMGGHEEGILAFGRTLDEAGAALLKWRDEFKE